MATRLFLIFAAAFLIVGRISVPGHGLTGWPGAFEAVSHILIGAMIAIAFLRSGSDRALAISLVIWASLFEFVMFKMQNG